jgi:flagellar basal-body rod protein FlgG
MNNALAIGATGMAAQQAFIDATANNLANANTPGFKAEKIGFQTLLHAALPQRADLQPGNDLQQATGMGVAPVSRGRDFTTGELKKTDMPLDLALNGDGFVEVLRPDGSSAYTRALSLQVNRDGVLATVDGFPLRQSINIPTDATSVRVDAQGHISAMVPDDRNPVDIAQLELVRFINPGGLLPIGNNLYAASEKAGDPQAGKAGDTGFGSISQGYLEASNVRLVDQMMAILAGRQAYSLSAKVVETADEMLGIVNNLRR